VSSSNPAPSISYVAGSLTAGSFSSYQWYLDGTPLAGANSATYNPGTTYGTYTVEVTNTAGCTGSQDYCFSPVSFSTSGPTTFCQGDTVILSVTNGDSFLWSTSSTNSSIIVTTAGNYSVTAYNLTANCAVDFQQTVTVNPNPTPTVSYNGGLLETQTYSSYQWYFNGTPIPGATFNTYIPSQSTGQYYVIVTDANGCQGTSNVFNYFASLSDYNNVGVSIYPNPTKDNLFISVEGITDVYTINVLTTFGQLIISKSGDNETNTINIAELPSGMYLVEIRSESFKKEFKVVKN